MHILPCVWVVPLSDLLADDGDLLPGKDHVKAPTDDLVGKERVVRTHDLAFPCKDGLYTSSKEARKATKQNI